QHTFVDAATNKGYDVLVMDGQLDMHFINQAETKFKESRFSRVDADIVEKLILKDDVTEVKLTAEQQEELRPVIQSQLKKDDHFYVVFENLSETAQPMMITQSEFMRRMKDMSAMGGGNMGFYGELPDSYNLVVNANHPLVKKVIEGKEAAVTENIKPLKTQIELLEKELEAVEKTVKDKKDDEIDQATKDKRSDLEKKIEDTRKQKEEILLNYGKGNDLVKQMIDLALLSNNMLKGEDLTKFIRRSVDMIK
ncbi:MAG: molecular chaperone HtpG, partial [Bacteroidales bacterium]|nr:molecular chaperone HtpG [Bacteroidales bacterium]